MDRLMDFLQELLPQKEALLGALVAERAAEGTLLGDFLEEVRRAARDLGLSAVPAGVQPPLRELAGGPR